VIDEVVPKTKELQQVGESTLRDIVKDEYGFRRDTAARYVDELREWFDLREHPVADGVLVTPAEYDRVVADCRDDAADEAADQLDDLNTGGPA